MWENKMFNTNGDIKRMYKVGFYNSKGERVLQDKLKPMTHDQARTFKSKMMNPANHFIYEVKL